MLANREKLKEMLAACPTKKRVGVAAAHDSHTLEAIAAATRDGLVKPVLIGDEKKIFQLWAEIAADLSEPEVIHVEGDAACAEYAVALARNGQIDCLMKGKLETATMMRAVVNRETGIRNSDVLSMIAILESPYYHKLFAVTDVGLLMYPTLEQKKAVIENAVELFHALGVETPKVAVLAAVEKENLQMPETVDAAKLKEMNEQGVLTGCVVEGPISYDLCMDSESAAIKGYVSPVAGDPDILVVPDIASGNVLSKALTCSGGAKSCGTVCGAKVPIIVTSRSAPAEDKYMSIILAAVAGGAVAGKIDDRE